MLSKVFNMGVKQYLSYRHRRIEEIRTQSPALQRKVLNEILSQSALTKWGLDHALSVKMNAEDIRKHIPLTNYESIKPYIDRMMMGESNVLAPGVTQYFAKSAGTTSGKSKYLPITDWMLKGNLIESSWDSMATVYDIRPEAKSFERKNLILGGSLQKFKLHPDTIVGDVSAIMLSTMPAAGRPFYCPDFETALMPEWEEKIEKIAHLASKEDIVMFAGVPTWNLVLFQRILEITGKDHMLEVWPNLKTYMHGGVGFGPYRKQFRELIPTDDFDYMEIYNASEGYFSIQDSDEDGMLLLTDHGVYFEFIPIAEVNDEQPTILSISEIKLSHRYALVITTLSGLWRYAIGDTIEIVSVSPYRIKVVGRTQQYINVFGEEVMIGNTDQAVAETCQLLDAKVKDYTVGPIYMDSRTKGGHHWLVEFEKQPRSIREFGKILDAKLQAINSDYEAKRYQDMALQSLKIDVLPNGSFYNWLKSKGKVGAQIKVPRLSNDRKYIEEILSEINANYE